MPNTIAYNSKPDTASDSIQAWAGRYITDQGWRVIPVPHKTKIPVIPGWQKLDMALEDIPIHFPHGRLSNLGRVLHNDADIDLDWPEARAAAAFFLPQTDCIASRAGAPRSHWFYNLAPESERPFKFIKLFDPTLDTHDPHYEEHATIVELRTGRNQTVIPPSVHESGESIVWHQYGEPAQISDPIALEAIVRRIGAAALLARNWTGTMRNQATLPLAGALLRHGWSNAEIKNFIRAVCDAAGDEELQIGWRS